MALGVCGWLVAAMAPFAIESSAVTFAVAAAMLGLGAVLARRGNAALDSGEPGPLRSRFSKPAATGPVTTALGDTTLRTGGVIAWLVAVALLVAVELWQLSHVPRSTYPTLSSLANEVLGPGHRVARAAAFVCWAGCGLIVVSRPSRRT